MNINTTRVLLAALLLATGPAVAEDDDLGPHRGMHGSGAAMAMHAMSDPAHMVRRISHWLELDETQTQELRNVVLAAKPQLLALREKAQANRVAIAALDIDAGDYGDQIQGLAAENGELATEMTLLMSQLRLDIHARLTPEQQQKLADGAGRMWQHREKHREKHHKKHREKHCERHRRAQDDEVEH